MFSASFHALYEARDGILGVVEEAYPSIHTCSRAHHLHDTTAVAII